MGSNRSKRSKADYFRAADIVVITIVQVEHIAGAAKFRYGKLNLEIISQLASSLSAVTPYYHHDAESSKIRDDKSIPVAALGENAVASQFFYVHGRTHGFNGYL